MDDYLRNRYRYNHPIVPYEISIGESTKLLNKIAFVTGGSGAIGRAICVRLAVEGAKVYIGGQNESKVEAVVSEIHQLGGQAVGCIINVTKINAIQEVIDNIVKQESKLDILVTNAGGSARDKHNQLVFQDIEVIRDVIDLNLFGTIYCCKEVAKHMIANNYGKIVTMSSTVGIQGKDGFSEYAAAKGGVVSFTRSLAIELGKYSVNVNCVTPGIIEREAFLNSKLEKVLMKNVLNNYGRPEDIANMVLFLVSDESSFITGQNFIVDGGRSLGLKGD